MAMLLLLPAVAGRLIKAHVKGYLREDGTYVREHDTKVSSNKKKVVGAQYGGKQAKNRKDPAGLMDDSAPRVPQSKKAVHLQPDDDGKPVTIHAPSQASSAASWTDPKAIATFTPGSPVPAELNGVPFQPWTGHPLTEVSWHFVDGQMPDLEEPDMPVAEPINGKRKQQAAGVIIEEPDGRVWLLRPTNGFGGYDATFPKGRVDHGMSLQASAIKEAFEETGLKVAITGYWGDVERTQTVARYYTAKRVGGTPSAMGWEAQAVQLVPRDQLDEVLNTEVDRKIVRMAAPRKAAKNPKKN